MRIVIGIPARMASSRYPGKPLCKILGLSMIEHVYKRCALTDYEVFVATCDKEIEEVVTSFGGKSIMTSQNIRRPGLRVYEACQQLKLQDRDIVVVVQGDEPLVHPDMIDDVIDPLLNDSSIFCTHLITNATKEDLLDTNEVKAIKDIKSFAIYFSRAPIPSMIRHSDIQMYKQVCVFAFRYKNMKKFNNLMQTPLEIGESIEMLRALEHRKKIKLIETEYKTKSVDTEEDRKCAEELMKMDDIYNEYTKK